MRRGFGWWTKAISNPAVSPPIFFLSAFLLGLCSSLLSARLDKTGLGNVLLIAVLAAVALVVLGPSVRKLWSKEEVAASVKIGSPVPHEWLVVLASPEPGIGSAEAAIRYHLPALRKVWLLYSRGEPPASEKAALALAHRLESEGTLRADQIHRVPLSVADFFDPAKVRQVVEGIYDGLTDDLSESHVMIDITGGPKQATAGAFLAGLPEGRHMEVVSAAGQNQAGYALGAGDLLQIAMDYQVKRVPRR